MTSFQNFAILVVSPKHYSHSRGFDEIASTLQFGLKRLGYEAPLTSYPLPEHRHIILGSNLLFTQKEVTFSIPSDSIIYNLEQLNFSSPCFNAALLFHFKHLLVWDYSSANMEILKTFNIADTELLPIAYTPELSRIPKISDKQQDIDILFYGSLVPRRKAIIESLQNHGLNVKVLFDVYGLERDEWISRSKIVLNIHHFEANIFELARVSYLLANQKFVISELGTPDTETNYFNPGLIFSQYGDLVETCLTWLQKSPEEREAIALKGHELIKSRPIEQYLSPLIQNLPAPHQDNEFESALRVDLGCGARKAAGYFGVDICPAQGVDLVANLNSQFPFESNSVDELRAHDVIEHLPDRIHTMNEIWRVCKPGALVDLVVPSSDGRGAFQDPTHVSFWNINSFQYFTVDYPGYLELCQQYGFQGAFRLLALKEYASPDRVIHVHAVLEALKSTDLEEANHNIPIVKQLRAKNYIIFPDWSQPEEDLFYSIRSCLKVFFEAESRSEITLLIDRSQASEELETSPEELLQTSVMDLVFSDGLEIVEGEPQVALLSLSDYVEWDLIKPKLTARVECGCNNQSVISVLRLDSLCVKSLNEIES